MNFKDFIILWPTDCILKANCCTLKPKLSILRAKLSIRKTKLSTRKANLSTLGQKLCTRKALGYNSAKLGICLHKKYCRVLIADYKTSAMTGNSGVYAPYSGTLFFLLISKQFML